MEKHSASPGHPKSFLGSDCFSDDTHCSPHSAGLPCFLQLVTESNLKVNAKRTGVKGIYPGAGRIYERELFDIKLQMP